MTAFNTAWDLLKMPLVRDSIEEIGDKGNFKAIFQDRDNPDKQYDMRATGGMNYHWPYGLEVTVSDPDNNSTVAFGNFKNYDPSWHPSNVKTRNDHRGKGIMTAIYDLVNEIATRRGDPPLHTYAKRLNDYSAPFWAKRLGLPYENHTQFQLDNHKLEWPKEGVFE